MDEHMKCPECVDGVLVLRHSRRFSRPFFGCSNWPACDCTHGAHPDGKPLGVPANKETRKWRIKAHDAFDRLWSGPSGRMSRKQAYRLMQQLMGMTPAEAHIGNFSIDQCQSLIQAIEWYLDRKEPAN